MDNTVSGIDNDKKKKNAVVHVEQFLLLISSIPHSNKGFLFFFLKTGAEKPK